MPQIIIRQILTEKEDARCLRSVMDHLERPSCNFFMAADHSILYHHPEARLVSLVYMSWNEDISSVTYYLGYNFESLLNRFLFLYYLGVHSNYEMLKPISKWKFHSLPQLLHFVEQFLVQVKMERPYNFLSTNQLHSSYICPKSICIYVSGKLILVCGAIKPN